jgi:hypothetical protein
VTTLASLKNTIADDLAGGSAYDTQIAAAINEAINYYQAERFYFNEARTTTITTVIGQREYSPDSSVVIVKLDEAYITVSNRYRLLTQLDPFEMELLHDSAVMTGVPARWAFYNRLFSLYPLPDAVYTVRLLGQIRVSAPASDTEADNPWMTEAFEAIRARAKLYLAGHLLMDTEMLQVMAAAEDAAVNRLRTETHKRIGTGFITPSGW